MEPTTLHAVVERANAFLASAREQAADGLTWAEFGRLLVSLLHLLVAGLDAVATMTGAEKKAIVLTAAATLFDTFAGRCVPLVLTPVWLVARSPIRLLILALASGAVEAILPTVRATA
jgi:hypothetical protein